MFSVFPIHQLNQVTNIRKTWYERYVTEGRPNVVTNTNLEGVKTSEVRATFN
jgi:hypothetical protein